MIQISETQSDVIDPARAAALQVALGMKADIVDGTPLPPFFHQLYFWSPQPPEGLGRDGHPRVGGLIPDMGLPRRMWAGGRLTFCAPLIAGQRAERRSVVELTVHKAGRSGPLGFVTLRHEIWQAGELCLTEWQDLVYREDPALNSPRPVAPQARVDETEHYEVTFDATLLFRYSALTFNGHRIHYDLDYARDIEGYAGLVVHGPLLAQHMMLMAGSLTGFSFRAVSPLMQSETAVLCRNGADMWVRAADGRLCMSATIG